MRLLRKGCSSKRDDHLNKLSYHAGKEPLYILFLCVLDVWCWGLRRWMKSTSVPVTFQNRAWHISCQPWQCVCRHMWGGTIPSKTFLSWLLQIMVGAPFYSSISTRTRIWGFPNPIMVFTITIIIILKSLVRVSSFKWITHAHGVYTFSFNNEGNHEKVMWMFITICPKAISHPKATYTNHKYMHI